MPLHSHRLTAVILIVMRLVLFDIDGTLLWTDGAGRRAIHRALLAEAGTAGPIDTYRFDGKTDPQIVRELLTHAGHPDAAAPELIAAVCRSYVATLREELGRTPDGGGTHLLPGVAALLGALESHESAGRAMVGLLTGNLKDGAELKLRAAGMEPGRFAVGAYGSDSGRRAELPPIAAQRAAERTGRSFAGADVVIIGDTPDDVACGRPIGARSVAVATGYYDTAALEAAGAAHVFETLADTAAVLDALLS
jgi:phosphoglycolate phosphatase-like HAD superfamily hydrolase